MVSERQADNPEPSHVARYKMASKSVRAGDKVLDVFCGTGYGARILASRGAEVTAFDKWNGQAKAPGITFIHSAFPFADFDPRGYNVITAFEAIEHVDREVGQELLRSIRFWLADDGIFWLSTPNAEVIPFVKAEHPHHLQHYTQAELAHMLYLAGFDIVDWLNQERKGTPVFRSGPTGRYMVCRCQ